MVGHEALVLASLTCTRIFKQANTHAVGSEQNKEEESALPAIYQPRPSSACNDGLVATRVPSIDRTYCLANKRIGSED